MKKYFFLILIALSAGKILNGAKNFGPTRIAVEYGLQTGRLAPNEVEGLTSGASTPSLNAGLEAEKVTGESTSINATA